MKRIYSHPNSTMVHQFKNVLENHGIETEVRGENLAAASWGLPPNEAWVELWLVGEHKLREAKQVFEELLADAEKEKSRLKKATAWTCPNCGEKVDAQFTVCWNCGAEEPE